MFSTTYIGLVFLSYYLGFAFFFWWNVTLSMNLMLSPLESYLVLDLLNHLFPCDLIIVAFITFYLFLFVVNSSLAGSNRLYHCRLLFLYWAVITSSLLLPSTLAPHFYHNFLKAWDLQNKMGIKRHLKMLVGKDELYISCFEIGHVRNIYINILAWLRGFQDKPVHLVLFSLYPSPFSELRHEATKVSEPC